MPKPTLAAKTPLAILESEIVALRKRAASLESRRDHAADMVAKASTARRRILVDADEPDPAVLAEADRTVRDAMDAEASSRDALNEIGERITQLAADVATMKEAEDRARQALRFDAAAEAIDATTARMRHAATLIAEARTDLASIITEAEAAGAYAPPVSDPDQHWITFLGTTSYVLDGEVRAFDNILPPTDVADRIAGHILAAVLPTCAVTSQAELSEFRQAGTATRALMPAVDEASAGTLLAGPLRTAAGALRQAAKVPS